MLKEVEKQLAKDFPKFAITVECNDTERGIVTLSGEVDQWQTIIDIGHMVAKIPGVRDVVSDMTIKGVYLPKKDYTPYIKRGREIGVIDKADVVVVGLGITGCAVARELSKYNLKIIALDMGEDVSTAATKANNGGVHMAGSVKPGTLKANLSVQGNRMYDKWAEELGFEFHRPGLFTVASEFVDAEGPVKAFLCAVANGDQRPELIDAEQTYEIEPKLRDNGSKVAVACWLPSQGKVNPYETAVALIENAAVNGVKVLLNCTVGDVLTEDNEVTGLITEKGIIKTKYIVNAAGVYADEISAMAGDRCYTIHPRKGTLAIIDKNKPPMTDAIVNFYISNPEIKSNEESKGGGTDVTLSKNILLGPSATEVPDKEDVETTYEDLEYSMSRNGNPNVTKADIIRIFAGTRPANFKEDYVIEMSPITRGFINAGAIQSPGIGSAPAVANMVENILKQDMEERGVTLELDPTFNPIRVKPVRFAELTRDAQDDLIRRRPEYGRVICRCESITEGEILDAIHSPVVPTTIDGIKRRTRAGMGRCQGGFCQPRVLEILARELGKEWTEINLKGGKSNILKKENR